MRDGCAPLSSSVVVPSTCVCEGYWWLGEGVEWKSGQQLSQGSMVGRCPWVAGEVENVLCPVLLLPGALSPSLVDLCAIIL